MSSENFCYEGDNWCLGCLPVDTSHPDVCEASGETDSPTHCCCCRQPLACSLTSEGVKYVLRHMKQWLERPPEEQNALLEGGYYEGSRAVDVVRDWAEMLTWYNLTESDRLRVEEFLEGTACNDT